MRHARRAHLLIVASGLVLTHASAPMASAQAKKPVPKTPARKESRDPTGADALVLRDGKMLLGQIYDPSPRGTYLVIVRRAWAEANLPAWAEKWTSAEKGSVEAAERQRRDRLKIWRRDRLVAPGAEDPNDRITTWLDREVARPEGPAEPSVLMMVRLARGDVKSVDRRGMSAARALRHGWLLGFNDAETMPLADLKDAISARGMTVTGSEPIPLDSLLPPTTESEEQWLLRRAATEVINDEGLRFIHHGKVVLPESAPGQAIDPAQAAAVLQDTIREVLGAGSAGDPLIPRLQSVAAKGRVGAIVTRLDLAPDLGSVTVESALYVRTANGWVKGPWRAGTIRVGDVAPGAAEAIGDDPQVKSAFSLIDSIAPGMVTPEMKRKGLDVGATTKRALGLARSALARELSALALPLDMGEKKPMPKL